MKFTKLATAFAALALVGANPAHADSFASALLDISNFKWMSGAASPPGSSGAALTNGTEITIQAGGANSASANASINGSGSSVSPVPPQGQLNAAGGVIPLKGVYNTGSVTPASPSTPVPVGGAPLAPLVPAKPAPNPAAAGTLTDTTTYAYGEYSLSGAVLNIPAGPLAGANAHSLAQSSVVAAGTGGTSASNVGTNVDVVSNITGVTHFELDYVLRLLAKVTAPAGSLDNARAATTWQLVITDTTNPANLPGGFTWKPGVINDNAAVAGVIGTSVKTPSGTAISPDLALVAGDRYSFSVNSQISSDVFKAAIPEPASLSLFGIGLLGLVASRRKNKASV